MCLILFGYHYHPDYPLVVIANRDEYYDRPAEPARFWSNDTGLLAGKDNLAGGTWLGITRSGRFAAITNFRAPNERSGPVSRGRLVLDFLCDDQSGGQYLETKAAQTKQMAGYNLLAGNQEGLYYGSNRGEQSVQLDPGLYGLSNHLLDTHWPKVDRGKQAFAAALKGEPRTETLFAILRDQTQAEDRDLPDTGVGQILEKQLSSRFICLPGYGTRSSTLVLIHRSGTAYFHERSYDHRGHAEHQQNYQLNLTKPWPIAEKQSC